MKNNRKAVNDRQQALLQMVQKKGEISVEEMAELLSVSQMTIRRDLSILEQKGMLIRKHGSAVSIIEEENLKRGSRNTTVYREALSAYAASLVDDGDTLFINGSRTALNLLNYTGSKKVNVLTNNGWALNGNYSPNVQIRMTGGNVYEHILIGEFAVESLIGLSADKLFVGCAAVYEDGEFRYDIPTEIGINEMMISRTKGSIYILADYTKIHEKKEQAMIYGCFRYSVPVTLITNAEADPAILRNLSTSNIRILTISQKGELIADTSQ